MSLPRWDTCVVAGALVGSRARLRSTCAVPNDGRRGTADAISPRPATRPAPATKHQPPNGRYTKAKPQPPVQPRGNCPAHDGKIPEELLSKVADMEADTSLQTPKEITLSLRSVSPSACCQLFIAA